MTAVSDKKELLSNALGVCTALKPYRAKYGNGGGLNLSKNEPIPVPVTVWGAESLDAEMIQYNSLEKVEELSRFVRLRLRWQNDGVAVSCILTRIQFTDGHLFGVAKDITVQEGRNNIWREKVQINVSFTDYYITVPQEIHGVLRRALH